MKHWSVRDCINESKKYDCRNDFRLGCNGAYQASKKFGILDNLFSPTGNFCGCKKYWTEETIKEEAYKYKTRSEFQKANASAYYASKRLGILEQLYPQKAFNKKPKKQITKVHTWSIENVRGEASKYKTRGEFALGSGSAYYAAHRLGLMDELFPDSTYTHWSTEKLKSESDKYLTRDDFRKGCYNGYFAAYRKGILNQISPNLKTKRNEEV